MAAQDPDVRYWSAVKAGNISAASKTQADHDAAMTRAREGRRKRLIQQADPDGTLAAADPAELERRVERLRRAELADMSLKAAQARRARGKDQAAKVDAA